MYDVIIVGAGPAGLTAGIYVTRAGLSVLILEGKSFGGQIINAKSVENYPGFLAVSGVELSKNMYEQVTKLGGEVKFERVMRILGKKGDFRVHTETAPEGYAAKAVILATGAENRKLGLSREEELTGKGVSYCATCDGNFYRGKDVAVIGGGNTALEDAVYLAGMARKVYLIHRRDEFRGDQANVEKVKALSNVELVLKANATEILGKEKVSGVKVKFDDGAERELEVSGIFIAVGYEPQNKEFSEIVELDEAGYVKTEDGVHTSADGIYAAGDARVKELKQLTTAVSDGSIAATAAVKEIK